MVSSSKRSCGLNCIFFEELWHIGIFSEEDLWLRGVLIEEELWHRGIMLIEEELWHSGILIGQVVWHNGIFIEAELWHRSKHMSSRRNTAGILHGSSDFSRESRYVSLLKEQNKM